MAKSVPLALYYPTIGLEDLRSPSEVWGLQNNLSRIYRFDDMRLGFNPMDYLVMKWSTPIVQQETWLLDIQTFNARLRMISHPARAKGLER